MPLARTSCSRRCSTAEQQKGFKGFYVLGDSRTGKGLTISLWETEADMTAGETSGFYQQQIAKFKDVVGGPTVREACEVGEEQPSSMAT